MVDPCSDEEFNSVLKREIEHPRPKIHDKLDYERIRGKLGSEVKDTETSTVRDLCLTKVRREQWWNR